MPDYTLPQGVISSEKEADVFPNFILSGPPLPDDWRSLKALCRFGTKEEEKDRLFFRVTAFKPAKNNADGSWRRDIHMTKDFCFEVDPLEVGGKVMMAMSGHKEDCIGQWLGHEVIYDESGRPDKVKCREYILESFYLFRLNKSQLRHVQDAKRAVENLGRHRPVNGEKVSIDLDGSIFAHFDNLNGLLDNLRSFLMEPTPFMGFRLYPVRSGKKKKDSGQRYPEEFTFYLGSMNAQDIITACKLGLQGYGIRFVGPLRVYEREGFRVSISTGNLEQPLHLDQEQRLYLRHSAQCFVESGVSRVPKIANLNGLKVMPLMESETRDKREIMLVNLKGRTAPLTAADAAKLFVIV